MDYAEDNMYNAGPSAKRAAKVTGSTSAASAATSPLAAASTSCECLLPGIEARADPLAAATSSLKSPTDEQEHAPPGPKVASRKLTAGTRTSFACLRPLRSEPIPRDFGNLPIFDGDVAPMTVRYECKGVKLVIGDKEEVRTALAQQVTKQWGEGGKSLEVSFSIADAQGTEIDVTHHHADFARHDSCELSFEGRPLEFLAKGPDFGDNEPIECTRDDIQPNFDKAMVADKFKQSLAPHAKVLSIWSQGTSKAATSPRKIFVHIRFEDVERDRLPLERVKRWPDTSILKVERSSSYVAQGDDASNARQPSFSSLPLASLE